MSTLNVLAVTAKSWAIQGACSQALQQAAAAQQATH